MCTATDAASVTIDFSKGNVEDGAVNSPPSRGPRRSPICSPSPLKRTLPESSGLRTFSPTTRPTGNPNRKLYDDEVGLPNHLRVEDGMPALPKLQDGSVQMSNGKSCSISQGRKRKYFLGAASAKGTRRLVNVARSFSSQSLRSESSPSSAAFGHEGSQVLEHLLNASHGGLPRSNDQKSLSKGTLGSARSLSQSELLKDGEDCEKQVKKLLKLNTRNDLSSSPHPRASRRDDILRGMARVRALEASNSNFSTEKKT